MDLEDYRLDYEKVQDITANFDNEARRIVDSYLEDYPDHDISEHENFTIQGISAFLMFWCANEEKINMTPELYERVVFMLMGLIPREWPFLDNLRAELLKTGVH